jgi:hypothetical protein
MKTDNDKLPGMVAEGRFMLFQMARTLLDADLLLADIDRATQKRAEQLQKAGWRIQMDLYTDESNRTTIALAAVSSDGRHQELRALKEAPTRAQ